MSIYTNRPLPPRKTYNTGFFPPTFNFYDWLSDESLIGAPPADVGSWHGWTKAFAGKERQWEPVVALTGVSGMCKYLGVCARNNLGTVQQFGVRLIINGAAAYTDDKIAVPASSQLGFMLLGRMFVLGNTPRALFPSVAPFDKIFAVYIYRDSSSIDVAVSRSIHLTS